MARSRPPATHARAASPRASSVQSLSFRYRPAQAMIVPGLGCVIPVSWSIKNPATHLDPLGSRRAGFWLRTRRRSDPLPGRAAGRCISCLASAGNPRASEPRPNRTRAGSAGFVSFGLVLTASPIASSDSPDCSERGFRTRCVIQDLSETPKVRIDAEFMPSPTLAGRCLGVGCVIEPGRAVCLAGSSV